MTDYVFVTDVTYVPVSKVTARVEVEDIIAAVRPNTCLISIMLANNETGVIMVRNRSSENLEVHIYNSTMFSSSQKIKVGPFLCCHHFLVVTQQ